MKNIRKIVLTGGPCAGKTTAIRAIQKVFTGKGFRVLAVSETASELLTGGISPFNMDNVTFQYIVTSTMRFKESMMELAAQTIEEENVLIVCDRAQMDNTAYMSDDQLHSMMDRLGTNIVEMRDGYDAVFHLETSAKSKTDAYSRNFDTNAARYESAAEAIATDNLIMKGWVGHPHMRIIPANMDFDAKIAHLVKEVDHVVCKNVEIERKFLIEKPTDAVIAAIPFARAVSIEQCYINDDSGKYRVRKRGDDGAYIYIKTVKSKAEGITRSETETRITEQEYEAAKERAEACLTKTRLCIAENGKYFELDIYPYSEKYAVIEIELCDEEEEFMLPSYLNVIREVTGENDYSNHTIARTHIIK